MVEIEGLMEFVEGGLDLGQWISIFLGYTVHLANVNAESRLVALLLDHDDR